MRLAFGVGGLSLTILNTNHSEAERGARIL